MTVYRSYYHHSVQKSVISWGSWSGVRPLMHPLSPYLVPSCQLALNALYVSLSVSRGGGRGVGVFFSSRTSQPSRAPTGHIGAVRVNNVRRKHWFDWPRGNSVWPNPGASGLFNWICRCIHTPADISIWTETKVLTGFGGFFWRKKRYL